MISFSCSCGQKFKVKPDFAGRKTTCPACKQPLVVPIFDSTQASLPKDKIDGTPSSIAEVGMDGGVTLEPPAGGQTRQKPVQELLARRGKSKQRYILAGEIARGGMGAVLRGVDCDIRREVAIKYLLDQSNAGKQRRFIEEAQITGQLEHPNIPPVHELAVDKDKRLFFSMKMVQGKSMAQVLDELRQQPKTAEKQYPLARLLNIFVNVCNALTYAHSRGVVHRDLKPANIMVGDFGEVYLMDWGLAKVMTGGPASEAVTPAATVVPSVPAVFVTAKRSSKVETSREPEADLTQEGSVLGTPVYMSPEQATGNLHAVNARSDIYSLGAILYEMLTLQPPVDKEGGYLSILMRVMEGEIVPPEQRTPQRAIPKDLAAIAMKALAKNPSHRYPNVGSLRQDIERYQEGRSISARQDTFKEMAWKLVKRNKLASVFTTVLTVVLLWGSVVNWLARRDAEQANARTKERTEKAVPALVRSARLLGSEGQFQEAFEQIDFALDYDAKYAEAKLLRGQLFIAQKNFAAGRAELEQYLREQPQDDEAKKLLSLCATGKPDDSAVLFAIAQVFEQQKVSGLAVHLFRDVDRSVKARRPVQKVYQKQIEEAWPGLGTCLFLEENGEFRLVFNRRKQVAALDPLKGMELNILELFECDRIADLTPLKGMPLTSLSLDNCILVRDLTAIRGMKLTSLSLGNCVKVSDLTPLKGMPLTSLNLANCKMATDLTPLTGMPLTSLNLTSCSQLTDLMPLKGMPLTTLSLHNCFQVSDLTPLKGMPLTYLGIHGCMQVRDLTPLKGMQLTTLSIYNASQVRDLTPLKGIPLTSLNLLGCGEVHDLTPLDGMKLTDIWVSPRSINKGMEVLRQMKSLKAFHINERESLPPEEFWKKYDAGEIK